MDRTAVVSSLQLLWPLHFELTREFRTPVLAHGHIEDAYSIDCNGLIVVKFHGFFIGESGILVHDATLIKSTYVALPGFSQAQVAHATWLAVAVQP